MLQMLFRLIEQILLCNLLQQYIHLQNKKRNAELNDFIRSERRRAEKIRNGDFFRQMSAVGDRSVRC